MSKIKWSRTEYRDGHMLRGEVDGASAAVYISPDTPMVNILIEVEKIVDFLVFSPSPSSGEVDSGQ